MMWLKLLTAVPLAQHEGEGIAKFLPIIIIFGLYLISFLGKLFQEKNKKTSEQAKPTRPIPPQQQPRRPAPPSRVPVYARKMQSPGDQPPPQPSRPKPAAPAAQHPRPAMPQPARPRPPIPPTRVTQPQPIPVPQRPIKIQSLPQQSQRISQLKPQKKTSQLPSQSVQEKPASSAAQQAKRREKVRTSHQAAQYQPVKKQTTPPASVQYNVPLNQLQTILNQPGELAKAVIYSEILGPPIALRPINNNRNSP